MPVPVSTVKPGGLKDFKGLHPAEFDGSGGPIKAKEWITQMEHTMTAALVPEEHRVKIIQIQFIGMARAWYDMLMETILVPL